MASQYASVTNAISSAGPFAIQAFLTATSAVASSRTSRLKEKWILRASEEDRSWRTVLRFVPWKTAILSLVYLAVQLFISVARTFGIFGFTKVRYLQYITLNTRQRHGLAKRNSTPSACHVDQLDVCIGANFLFVCSSLATAASGKNYCGILRTSIYCSSREFGNG